MSGLRRIASVLLGLTLVVAGCGDTSEDDSLEIESSDEQLIEQATTWVTSIEGR